MREKSIYIQFEDFYCAACVGNAQSRNTFCLCIFKKQTKTETNKQTNKQNQTLINQVSSGVRIYFILVVFKFYTPNTGTSAAHRVSGSHYALLLWFRKLTNFTHTLISCIRAEGARQSAICARRKKKPSHFNDRVVPIETPKQKDKMVDRTPRRLGVSNSPLGRGEDGSFQVVLRKDFKVGLKTSTHNYCGEVIGPKYTPNDYLFDEVVSRRGSCRNSALGRSSWERLQLAAQYLDYP